MAAGKLIPNQTAPLDFSGKLHQTKKNTSSDHLPSGAKVYGQVMADAKPSYTPGAVAAVVFAGASPLHNLRPQGSFVEVQKCADMGCSTLVVVATDTDWETRLSIVKKSVDLVYTARTWHIDWFIPATASGFYRIKHMGTSYDDPLIGKATFAEYFGQSSVFVVAPATPRAGIV